MNAYKAAVEEKIAFLVTVMRCLSRTIRRQLIARWGVIPRRWFKRWTVFLTCGEKMKFELDTTDGRARRGRWSLIVA